MTKDEALRAARDALRNSGEASGSARTRAALTAIEAALSAGEVGAEALPETPTPEFLEPFARKWCVAHGIDPDEPSPPHGEWPRWYDECGAFAAMYSDMRAAMFAAAPPAPADDIAALRAENERLRAALTPFANFGGLFDAGEITGASDTDELLLAFDDDRSPRLEKFTVGEFRAAAAALNEGGDHDR